MNKPTCGRILLYTLTYADAERINLIRRQGKLGNYETTNSVLPLLVTRVWRDEYGVDVPGVNGQLMCDGEFTIWICSSREGKIPGTWHWPERE